MIVVVTRPLESFENELHTLLKVQSTEINTMNATRYQFPDHVDREFDAIVFYESVVMLQENEVIARDLSKLPTLISSRSARIDDGTEVPQSFVIRRKDA